MRGLRLEGRQGNAKQESQRTDEHKFEKGLSCSHNCWPTLVVAARRRIALPPIPSESAPKREERLTVGGGRLVPSLTKQLRRESFPILLPIRLSRLAECLCSKVLPPPDEGRTASKEI